MKKFTCYALVVSACLLLVFSGSLFATPITGTIWESDAAADAAGLNLNAGTIAGLGSPDATFNLTGVLNFVTMSGPVTYGSFLGQGGVVNNWAINDLSAVNMTTSTGHGTILEFTWTDTVFAGEQITVRHDDGFYLQVGSVNYGAYGNATSDHTDTFGLTNAPGTYTFHLYYSAYNSYPEILQYSHSASPVPEPASALLLGSGLIGLVAFGRKLKG